MGYEGDFTEEQITYIQQSRALSEMSGLPFDADRDGVFLDKSLSALDDNEKASLSALEKAGLITRAEAPAKDTMLRVTCSERFALHKEALEGVNAAKYEGILYETAVGKNK